MNLRLANSFFAVCIVHTTVVWAQAPPLIAPTDPLPPRKQKAEFQLPEGFEIQLVLSEPDIGQPMNLNFDAKGRLWVSHSVEYPYPAQGEGVEPRKRFAGVGDHPPRDRVTVVDEIGPDGRATKIRHFAEGLNLPIGQTPLGDGSSALVYSIPAIFRHTDTDGDGKADKTKELYGRFGNVDTHGMSNSFTPWIDGWIYGCHGFANHSVITDGSGNTTEMTSGNTYRFRADGSRFELFTFGQVNPFGMAFDPLGNLFDADCHSMPVYLLLRGASYPHFGKKPGPLGFGPKMINHNHGSTGICGVCYYADRHFPPKYQRSLFLCNPVTGRVHHDRLKAFGSTYQAETQPDFIRCKDPWFRPVDAVLGPDGALYIADFYNAIIGHYEVPLEHPKRDRQHGRVWRVVYRDEDENAKPVSAPDLTAHTPEQLLGELADENLLVRTLATNHLVSTHASKAGPLARKALKNHASPFVRAHALWVVERLGGLTENELSRLARDRSRLVRVHLVKALAERKNWEPAEREIVRKALFDEDAFVQRAAAEGLGRHPHPDNWQALLRAWTNARKKDTHLIHTIKLALKSHFESESAADGIPKELSQPDADRLLTIATASASSSAVDFLLERGDLSKTNLADDPSMALQIAKAGSPEQIKRLIELAKADFEGEPVKQFEWFKIIGEGFMQRGLAAEDRPELRRWFEELAPRLLDRIANTRDNWKHIPLAETPHSPRPWGLRERKRAGGGTIELIDSISHGEHLTGIYRSEPFSVPARFDFWMCGHNGLPGTNPPPVNHVRLRLKKNDQVIAKEHPPRSDTAKRYRWDLSEHKGQKAVFEIVDAHQGEAYAWIAAGGFNPPVISMPGGALGSNAADVFGMISRFGFGSHRSKLEAIATDKGRPVPLRATAAASAIEMEAAGDMLPLLQEFLNHVEINAESRSRIIGVLGNLDTERAREILIKSLQKAPASEQREIAIALCSTPKGAAILLDSIQRGKASARLFQNQAVKTRFDRQASTGAKKQAAGLLKRLPDLKLELLRKAIEIKQSYQPGEASPEQGKVVFQKNCALCHKVGDEGKLIGPQLDGVGLRGIDRLWEDVLDPNRNVDAAFRTQTILTKDGRVFTGLPRRKEGRVLVIADQQGEEISIPQAEIEQTRSSRLSLMPANYVESLKPEEIHNLLAYLLTLQNKPSD